MLLLLKIMKAHKFILLLIGGILLYFIVTEKWIGNDGERWKFIVESDGRGYYAYLPAIFIYQDLKFDFVKRNEAVIYGEGLADHLILMNGERGNKYFIGEAVMLAPFFLLAWLISWLTDFSLSGYNQIFFGSVSIAALFYLLVALSFIRKFLIQFKIREIWIQTIIILLVFGSNVFHYTVYEPSVSHIYSFAAISGFIYFIKKFQIEKYPRHLLLSAISLGLIVLIRPVNGVIILAIPFLIGSYNEFKVFINDLFQRKKLLTISTFSFLIIVSIQLFINYLIYGKILYWPYSGEGFDFLHPHFIDTLFSYRKGLFIYTPLILISIIFIFLYIKKSFFSATFFILFFLILNYILSSWSSWFYGGSYSLRAFMEFYPLLIIPLATGINEIRKTHKLIFLSFLFTVILCHSIIQTYQYEHNIIHFESMDKEKYWKVFLKTNSKYKYVSYPIVSDTLNETNFKLEKKHFNDFEGFVNWGAGITITSDDYYSGHNSSKIYIPNCFSPTFSIQYYELLREKISGVKIQLLTKSPKASNEGTLVVSFENDSNKIYKYISYPLSKEIEKSINWETVQYSIKLPLMKENDIMKIYVWNNSQNPIYIDDFLIELFSSK